MTKIILCCSAGMSTCLFIQKIKRYAEEIREPISVKAVGILEIETYLNDDTSIIVLSPQVRSYKDEISSKTDKPVMVIDIRDYGTMNVQKVLPQIVSLTR